VLSREIDPLQPDYLERVEQAEPVTG